MGTHFQSQKAKSQAKPAAVEKRKKQLAVDREKKAEEQAHRQDGDMCFAFECKDGQAARISQEMEAKFASQLTDTTLTLLTSMVDENDEHKIKVVIPGSSEMAEVEAEVVLTSEQAGPPKVPIYTLDRPEQLDPMQEQIHAMPLSIGHYVSSLHRCLHYACLSAQDANLLLVQFMEECLRGRGISIEGSPVP